MIGDNLKKIFKEKKLNQTEFSKISGVKRSYLSKIYNDKQVPTIPVLIQIADALQCSTDQLLGRS